MLNIYERQIRLYQLGYYNKIINKEITNDKIDGKWGPNCKKALIKFQKDNKIKVDGSYGPESNNTLEKVYNKFMSEPINWNDPVLANFKASEYPCKCGCKKNLITKQLVYNEQAMRHYLGVAMNNTSGYRCPSHNAKVGGSATSKHKDGKAVDSCSSKTATLSQRKKAIKFWTKYMPNARHAYCNGYRILNGKTSYPKVTTMGTAVHYDVY